MTTGGCVVLILIKKRKEREFSSGGIRVVPPRPVIIIPPSPKRVVKELQTIYESFVNTACSSTAMALPAGTAAAIVHPQAIPLPAPARYGVPSAVQLMVRQHEGDHGRDYSEEFLRD